MGMFNMIAEKPTDKKSSAMSNRRRLIGIDPGTRYCGYGIVDGSGRYVASGRIDLTAGRKPLHERLSELHAELKDIIAEYAPTEAVIEKVFFSHNVQAALSLGHARGVIMITASSAGLAISEYTAVEVKKAVTGSGRAEKEQVQQMVKTLLKLKVELSPDSADALALCLCHMQRDAFNKAVEVGQ